MSGPIAPRDSMATGVKWCVGVRPQYFEDFKEIDSALAQWIGRFVKQLWVWVLIDVQLVELRYVFRSGAHQRRNNFIHL